MTLRTRCGSGQRVLIKLAGGRGNVKAVLVHATRYPVDRGRLSRHHEKPLAELPHQVAPRFSIETQSLQYRLDPVVKFFKRGVKSVMSLLSCCLSSQVYQPRIVEPNHGLMKSVSPYDRVFSVVLPLTIRTLKALLR